KEVADEVEMRGTLVVGFDHVPGRLFDVAVRKHLVLRLGVIDPAGSGLQVHRAQLPALAGIVDAPEEAPLLLVIADREPVLDEDALARRVPSFEDDDHAQAALAYPLLELEQLHLEPPQLLLVALLGQLVDLWGPAVCVLALDLLVDRHLSAKSNLDRLG